MAAGGATLTTIASLLKEVYEPRIREQLNQDTTFLKRIQSSSSNITNEIGGKYVTYAVHTSRNAGLGSRFEYEALPVPGAQGFTAARVGLKYAYSGVQLSGQSITLTETNPQAFASVLDEEVSNMQLDIQKDMNRQLFGDGTGRIAGIQTGATGVNSFVLDDARLVQIGEVVDIVTVAGTVQAVAARTVTNVVVSSNTVTISGATVTVTGYASGAATQFLARTGSSYAGGSGNRELTGIQAIVAATGVLFNIDPSSFPLWAAVSNNNAGTARALSEGLMINTVDQVRVNGGTTTVGFTSLGVRRSYFNLLSQTRETVNSQDFTGGFRGLAFVTDNGEIPIVTDVDAPLNKIWFLNEGSFTYYRDQAWHFMDRDTMWKQVRDTNGDYDAWYARMAEYHELGIDRRNSQAVLADITES